MMKSLEIRLLKKAGVTSSVPQRYYDEEVSYDLK